jgi:hypothetical protein
VDRGSVATTAALAGFGDSRIIPGDEVYVTSDDADFVYRVAPPLLVADADSIVKSIFLPGYWVRRSLGAFLGQADWFVSAAGNNANDGATLLSAITEAERQRRWGIVTQLAQPTTVTYVDSPATPTNYNVQMLTGGTLRLQGARTTVKSGLLTGVTSVNRATHTPWDATAAELVAGDAGSLIRITGGARSGAYARLVLSLTGTRHRTSPWGTATISGDPFTQVTPVIGDPYEVASLPTLQIGTMQFAQQSNATAGPSANAIAIDSIFLDGGISLSGGGAFNSTMVCWFSQCIMKKMSMGGGGSGFYYVVGGGVDNCNLLPGAQTMLLGGGSVGGQLNVYTGGYLYVDKDWICQDSRLKITTNGHVEAGLFSIFDVTVPDAALNLQERATYRSRAVFGADLLWGTGNAGHAVKCKAAAALTYVTKPTINDNLTPARQVVVGSTDKDWSAIPFNDSGAGASGGVVAFSP